jgi:hypothetical protein
VHHADAGVPVEHGEFALEHHVADPPPPPGQPVDHLEELEMTVTGGRDDARRPLVR